jgi:hypothetical protein
MSYDNWKTRNRDDEQLQLPPCETKPQYDDEDVCQYCGAQPTQGCQYHKA